MENWLTTITDAAARNDGEAVQLTLHTQRSAPVQMALKPVQIEALTVLLLQLSQSAGTKKGVDPGLSADDPAVVRPIQASNVAAMLGSPGEVVLVFRMGVFDLGFSVPTKSLLGLARQIAALGIQMESEPRTVQ